MSNKMERGITISIRIEEYMKKRLHNRKQVCIFLSTVLLIFILSAAAGYALRGVMIKSNHKEAENIIYHYSDKIMLQMKGTLNEADALAHTALIMQEDSTEWFADAASSLLEREEVCFAFFFEGDTLVSALPDTEFGSLKGKKLEDFSYIFTMAKVVKDTVVEGPVRMEFDSAGQEVFLFLQPVVKDHIYLGEIAVALEQNYVLEQLGLQNLKAQGYDYELWRVEPQNGAKDVIASSKTRIDFSGAEKIVFYLPTQWNLSIQPMDDWISSSQKREIIIVCTTLTFLLMALAFLLYKFYVLRFTVKEMELKDKKTGLFNREGFAAMLDRWMSQGNCPVHLFYFSYECFGQTAQLLSSEEETAFLGSIPEHLNEYIRSPFIAGRVGDGNFLVAVREEMGTLQREAFAKGLSLELLLKYRLDGKKSFLMPQYQYIRCERDGSSAEIKIRELILAYHIRVSQESPIKMLTEKCRQLMEGKEDVVFNKYTNPEMLELSKTFNRYRKRTEQLAYSDPIFKVGNRPKFFRDANMLISYDKKRRFSLYCLDICGFSQYNELFSADVGDEILHEVRRRMSRSFGTYLYRINGDVFLGISVSEESMELITDRLLHMFDLPVLVKNISFPLQVRIAACRYPDHGRSPGDLIDRIQSALRYAKESDQNIVIYNDVLDDMLKTETHILHRLKDAIEQNTLEMWYQPIMLLETGRFSAVEALVRLPDGNGGYFSAGQVVALAERNGIVEQLGDYVLNKACTFMKAYGEELGLLRMGINLSVQQLLVGNSSTHLKDLIRATDLRMNQITLEITESILIQSIEKASETLAVLRKAGIHVALDDFGVGYSSLNYLSNLPVDIIKIDRSLTRQILTNFKQHTLLKAIVDMASINDLTVVAEGVETEAEQKVIAASGVQYIQGYYYAHPMPEEELIRFLRKINV